MRETKALQMAQPSDLQAMELIGLRTDIGRQIN